MILFPVHTLMRWIFILNPLDETFEKLKLFIQEVYEYVVEKFIKRNL